MLVFDLARRELSAVLRAGGDDIGMKIRKRKRTDLKGRWVEGWMEGKMEGRWKAVEGKGRREAKAKAEE